VQQAPPSVGRHDDQISLYLPSGFEDGLGGIAEHNQELVLDSREFLALDFRHLGARIVFLRLIHIGVQLCSGGLLDDLGKRRQNEQLPLALAHEFRGRMEREQKVGVIEFNRAENVAIFELLSESLNRVTT
jgi:hypothetical protein